MIIQALVLYYSEETEQLLVDSNFLLEEGFPMKGEKNHYSCFSDFKQLNDQEIDFFTLSDHGNFKRKMYIHS